MFGVVGLAFFYPRKKKSSLYSKTNPTGTGALARMHGLGFERSGSSELF